MRTITLELLRHGPAHNQLLSPLTPYLALCENHGAVTLHVPFEHNQFLYRLDALGYRLGAESRLFQLKDTAAVLGELFGMIPGLTAEANRSDGDGSPLTHLRLIISSSELALLPFELALSPSGFPGAGQYLLLQSQLPVCLTREIRRAPDAQQGWHERKPKILFAAAAPPEVGAIPLESHLLALRRAIQPWVRYYKADDQNARAKRVREHLEFLPEASIETIEQACAEGEFTHVHILAHGVKRMEGHDTRFLLALHDANDAQKTDCVSGARLATALRASNRSGCGGLANPTVVTLASCDSGNVGSVAGAGASIAHALHEAGIAMVVAGQFPLSFDGSVRMVEVLYEGLLWGADPRPLLYDLRRRLYSQFGVTHDWASLTAYVSLPPLVERQFSAIQIKQAKDSIEAAMNHADEATRQVFTQIGEGSKKGEEQKASAEDQRQLLDSALEKIEHATERLERLLKRIPAERQEIYALLGSTEKRRAELWYSIADAEYRAANAQRPYSAAKNWPVPTPAPKHAISQGESNKHVLRALDHYWNAFKSDRRRSGTLVQYLSLALVVRESPWFSEQQKAQLLAPANEDRPEKEAKSLWTLAHTLSCYDLHDENRRTQAWGHGNMMELYLLALLLGQDVTFDEASERVTEHVDHLMEIAGRDSFAAYSTRRQLFRYMAWYDSLGGAALEPLAIIAEHAFKRFPPELEAKYR